MPSVRIYPTHLNGETHILVRCMRHFAIYDHPWPARTAGQRALYMPTPREEVTPSESASRRVSAKVLSTLDKKLAAAAKNPGKSRLRDVADDEPPAKKRKYETSASASAKVKPFLSANPTRSGRQSRLSTKAQETDVRPKVKEPEAKAKEPEVKVKRPVGRPRKHPLPVPPPAPRPRSPSPCPEEHTPPRAVKLETISAPVTTVKPGPNRNMRPYTRPNKTTTVQYQPRGVFYSTHAKLHILICRRWSRQVWQEAPNEWKVSTQEASKARQQNTCSTGIRRSGCEAGRD